MKTRIPCILGLVFCLGTGLAYAQTNTSEGISKEEACKARYAMQGFLAATWTDKNPIVQSYIKVDNMLYYTVALQDSTSGNGSSQATKLFSYNCSTNKATEMVDITTAIDGSSYRSIVGKFGENFLLLPQCFGGCGGGQSLQYKIANVSTASVNELDLKKIPGAKDVAMNYMAAAKTRSGKFKSRWVGKDFNPFTFHPSFLADTTKVEQFIEQSWWHITHVQENGKAEIAMDYRLDLDDGKGGLSLPGKMNIDLTTRTIDQESFYTSTLGSQAMDWMYTNGLTKYSTREAFRDQVSFTREQAAKFFGLFATKILGKTPDTTKLGCDFSDINTADTTLVSSITTSCQLGLFKGSQGVFRPKGDLTRGETAAVLIRMIDGPQDESGKVWYTTYANKLISYGLSPTGGSFDGKKIITRGEVGELLYNAR